MRRTGRPLTVAVVLAALLLAGCYGSTEPATDIGFGSANLHGRGTTGSTPAYSFFEYWPTAHPTRRGETSRRDWPADVTGPFAIFARSLAVDTPYSFRMCGGQEGEAPVCAQTRTFRTGRPDGDLVIGEYPEAEGFRPLDVNATSGPGGEDPAGFVSVTGRFSGRPTKVEVNGNRAAVIAEGTAFGAGFPSLRAAGCLQVVDGGPDNPPDSGDLILWQLAITEFGQTLGPCELPPAGSGGSDGAISVFDAPAGDS